MSPSSPPTDPILRHRLFTDGACRTVYTAPDRRQYVLGYDGEKVCGVWLLADEAACAVPIIVAGRAERG
jgi:hypothetical protein